MTKRKVYRVVSGPWRFYLPIGVKSLIAFFVVICVLAGGILYFTTYIFTPEVEKKGLEGLESKLSGAWRVYYSRMDQMKYGMLQAASEGYVREAIRNKDSLFLQQLLKGYAVNRPYVDFWAVVDERGRVIGRRNGRTGDILEINGMISRALRTGEVLQTTEIVDRDILNLESRALASRVEREGLMQLVVTPVVEDGKSIGAFVTGILLDGYSWLPNAIYQYFTMESAIFASIFRNSRVITATRLPTSIFTPLIRLPQEVTDPILKNKGFRGKTSIGGAEIFVAADPILNGKGKVIGGLALAIYGREIKRGIRTINRQILLYTLLGIAVSLVFAAVAYRDTVRPVNAMTRAMEDVASGNLEVRVELSTNDEFERLGFHLNQMIESIRLRERRLARFNELTKLLITSLDPDTILRTALAKVVELTDSHLGIVYLHDEREEVLRPICSYGVGEDELRILRVGEGIPGRCALEKKTIFLKDIPGEGLHLDLGFAKVTPKVVVWFAMCYKEKLLGVMAIGSLRPYSEDEILHLEHLVAQVAIALENAMVHKKMERLSITDPLTGLYNRRYFFRRLEGAFEEARRYHFPISLLIMDVDDFKAINDTFGHEKGDRVLKELARILKNQTRTTDVWARYGGEEFIGYLSHCEGKDALEVADKIRRIIEGYDFKIDRDVTVSIGVSCYPCEGVSDVYDLLKRADEALYQAKRSGKNRIVM